MNDDVRVTQMQARIHELREGHFSYRVFIFKYNFKFLIGWLFKKTQVCYIDRYRVVYFQPFFDPRPIEFH